MTQELPNTTLWIIEDNAAFRSNLTEVFNETKNIKVKQDFSSCEEAISHLPEAEIPPQLILLDLSLPGISGIEGLERIKSTNSEIKIIVLTGSDQKKDVFNAISLGAAGYLLKNTPIDQIISGVEDVISGGASLDPHIASMVLGAFSDIKKKSSDKKQANEHGLTNREVEVLELLAEGKSIKEISGMIHLSSHTIKFHVANTYKKLNVQSQAGAVAKGIRDGII